MFELRREFVECFAEIVILDIKVIVSIVFTSRCIAPSTMLRQKSFVLILLWILLASQEQHVFTEMRQPIKRSFRSIFLGDDGVTQAATADKHGGWTGFGVFIVDQNALETVLKPNVSVDTVVEFSFTDSIW